MLKKKGSKGRPVGAEEAAQIARQTGLLDAYTEDANTNTSDSDKFKEGYKKKGKKNEKPRKSESEDVQPKEEPKEVVESSWETPEPEKEEAPIDSWEDIEAPDMPVPTKVKKQEKQRKKEEEKKARTEPVQSRESAAGNPVNTKEGLERVSAGVEKVSANLEQLSLRDGPNASKGSPPVTEKQELPSVKSATTKQEPVRTNPIKEGNSSTEAPADSDAVKADRDAKKAAKAAAKAAAKQKKTGEVPENDNSSVASEQSVKSSETQGGEGNPPPPQPTLQKTEEERKKEEEKARRKAEFEAKRTFVPKEEIVGEKSKTELKAERRAKQEAQRAVKSQGPEQKVKPNQQKVRIPDEIQADQEKVEKKLAKVLASHNLPPRTKAQRLVPLFSHLHQYEKDNCVTRELPVLGGPVHPAVVQLGLQYSEGMLCGSEERCSALLSGLERVLIDSLQDLKDIPNSDLFKELDTALKPNLTFLKQCRPLSIPMSNAVRAVKSKLRNLDRSSSIESLSGEIKTIFEEWEEENLYLAAKQISLTAGKKIQDGDVILTYSSSALVNRLLLDAAKEKKFKVIVADGRPHFRGKNLVERLVKEGVETTYILLSAITQVLPLVTKVFLGCDGVMANGCVLAEVGTSQVALMAESVGVPVLVCSQTFKFTHRVQTDSFVNNELLDPEDVALTNSSHKYLKKWREQSSLHILNLVYDVTPACLISAVITELSVIPTTSVPVILRLKNSDGQLDS